MDPLLERLDRIEAKLDLALNKAPKEVLSAEECMSLTGCRSKRAQFDWFKKQGIKPYQRGRYRRLDVRNRVAHLALFPDAPIQPK